MDFFEDIRLVDGPVLWTAWAAGVGGLVYLLWWRDGASRSRLLLRSAAAAALSVLLAAALVAGGHWLLIYVFSAFPEVLPREVLAWTVPAVAALLLLILRLRRIWAAKRPAHPLRATSV